MVAAVAAAAAGAAFEDEQTAADDEATGRQLELLAPPPPPPAPEEADEPDCKGYRCKISLIVVIRVDIMTNAALHSLPLWHCPVREQEGMKGRILHYSSCNTLILQ